jgi:hypothetical protein
MLLLVCPEGEPEVSRGKKTIKFRVSAKFIGVLQRFHKFLRAKSPYKYLEFIISEVCEKRLRRVNGETRCKMLECFESRAKEIINF